MRNPGAVLQETMRTRPGKYALFFAGLRTACRLLPQENANTLLFAYAGCRFVDNRVDGDFPLPQGYRSCLEYIDRRIEFLETSFCEEPEDELLAHARESARRAGFSIDQELRLILGSMRFDAARAGTCRVSCERELREHFFTQDISGTTRATLKVFSEDPSRAEALAPLATASRIHYNLRDFEEDIGKGYVNIPIEDLARHGVSRFDPQDPGVRAWCRQQAYKGMRLLERHDRSGVQWKPLTKAALDLGYALPARRCFRSVL